MRISTLRIILGAVIPPALGSLLFSLGTTFMDEQASWLMAFPVALFGLLFAYPIIILPSLIYSLVMERIIRKKKENPLFYYGAAVTLGWLSSSVLALNGIAWDIFAFNSLVGILTGFCTALMLRRIEISDESKPNECEPGEVVNASSAARLSENQLHD